MPMSPKLLRPRQTGFDPRSISGLALWLDAADASTITIGTGVSVWADKSGNGRNATQATGGKQPAYTNTLNRKNVVTFQGVDDTMQIANVAAFNGAAVSYVIVARQQSSANQALFYKATGGTVNGFIFRFRAGTVVWPYQANDNVAETLANNSNDNTAWNVYSTVLQASSQESHRNGVSFATAAAIRTYDDTGAIWLGSRRDASEFLAGDIAEVLLFSRAITANERSAVERALGKKWGITVS